MANTDVSKYPFALDRALYVNKLIKGIRSPKPYGPYWYAHYWDNGAFRSFYIGKELPEECKPYVNGGRSPQSNSTLFSVEGLTEALDKGMEIQLDIGSLAHQCNARYRHLTGDRYQLYRDPVGKETLGSGTIFG